MPHTDQPPAPPRCLALSLSLSLSLLGACTGSLTRMGDETAGEAGADATGDDSGDLGPAIDTAGDLTPADARAADGDAADGADPAVALPDVDGAADGAAGDAPDEDVDAAADGDPDLVEDDGAVSPDCATYGAEIVSHSIPTTLQAGDVEWVSVTVANTGETTWTEAAMFRLGSPDDSDPFVEDPRQYLPEGVAIAGDAVNPPTYTWVFEMRAPSTGGAYVTDWQMLRENTCWFGEVLSVPITVEGNIDPGVCGPPLPPWEDERSHIKLNCGGAWCDATPICHGCEYCAEIGLGCMPGTGPMPPCTPRCDCPVRPDGHPERGACEEYYLGGRPFWRTDGTLEMHPDNDFLGRCHDCTWIEVCWADGTRCTRVTF